MRSRYGQESWAVVTGTDSVAQEFIKQLTLQRFNVVVVDEDKEGLAEAVRLAEQAGVKVQAVHFPWSARKGWESYEELCKEVAEDKDISILINNVEQFDPSTRFTRLSDEQVL